jgi:opacity protein-like surface antigen
MQIKQIMVATTLATPLMIASSLVQADENVFGYIKGAEVLPKGAWEFDQTITYRDDKDVGSYHAWDTKTEIEIGVTNRFQVAPYLKGQSISTKGLLVDAYIPKDESYGLRASGVGVEFKYNFLSPAKDDFGLTGYVDLGYSWLDTHSGQDKDSYSVELQLLAQKYFMEGQMTLAGNIGVEATHATRGKIDNLPADFEWPTHPEMEIELLAGAGISYRFMPNWSVGLEALYQSEYETEVNQERWSLFAGPNLHYGGEKFWATLTYFPQIVGGGAQIEGQSDSRKQLVEKTETEIRFKVGFDF